MCCRTGWNPGLAKELALGINMNPAHNVQAPKNLYAFL
jgi:hypothetical protein